MKYVILFALIAGIMTEENVNDNGTAPGETEMEDSSGQGSSGSLGQNPSEVDNQLSEAELMNLGFERQTVQPDWIIRFGITSDDLRRRMQNTEDFVETVSPLPLVTFDADNENAETTFVVSSVKASEWVFLTFTDAKTQEKHEFFFPYSAVAENDTIFLRELREECLKPVIIEPKPPTVAKCHYFYKKITEAYEFSVKEVGPVDGAELLECYVESVKKMTRQPQVEILCVEGGIVDSQYKELSRDQYEQIKASHTDNGDGTYTGAAEETETVKVNAK